MHCSIRSLIARGVALSVLGAPLLAQSALVEEGNLVFGVGNVTSISNIVVNDSGDWIVEVDTDNANTDIDSALLSTGGSLLAREGESLTAPSGASINSFDAVTLNNSGNSGWNFFLSGTSGISDDSGIYLGKTLVLQEGTISGAAGFSAGTPYIGFFETKFNDAGDILVMASIDDPAISSTVDRALVVFDVDGSGTLLSETVIAKEGDLLSGQTETVADFETGPHNFAYSDLGDVMFIADLNGATSVDHAVYVNDVLVAQEGSASPVGTAWSVLSSAEIDLNDNCEYVISGSLDGPTSSNLLIEKNGAKFRQEGDTLAAISPFLLTSFGTGPVAISNSSEVLWYGDWDDPDTDVDTGLFVDDTLLVQEGVTTIGGIAVDTLRGIQDGYAISPNGRYVIFEAILADGTEGAYLIDRGIRGHMEKRNGDGSNPVCFSAVNRPIVGGTWTTEVDASNHPGATTIFTIAYSAPASGPVINAGQVLIDLGSTLLGKISKVSSGGIDTIDIPVSNDVNIIGMTAYVQPAILGGGAELCNAIDATVGN